MARAVVEARQMSSCWEVIDGVGVTGVHAPKSAVCVRAAMLLFVVLLRDIDRLRLQT